MNEVSRRNLGTKLYVAGLLLLIVGFLVSASGVSMWAKSNTTKDTVQLDSERIAEKPLIVDGTVVSSSVEDQETLVSYVVDGESYEVTIGFYAETTVEGSRVDVYLDPEDVSIAKVPAIYTDYFSKSAKVSLWAGLAFGAVCFAIGGILTALGRKFERSY